MVTHGHGQGYADINFVIPETVERYQLWKGPYFPQFGDFDNAGALNLVLKDEFEENFVLAEGGSFDQQRYVFGASPRLWSVKTLFAGQAFFTLSKYNGLAKLTAEPTVDSRLSFSGSVYQGDWDGSGQVPLREVSAGRLDRFGSIDPTEGGRTDREPRSPLPLHADAPRRVGVPGLGRPWCAPGRRSARERSSEPLRAPLWSDFTFFKDAGLRFVLGPQGQTIDTGDALPIPGAHYVPPATASSRTTRAGSYGARGSCTRTFELFGRPMQGQVGLETRNDHIDVALYRQVERNRYFTINKVKVDERSFSGYLSHQTFFLDWIRLEVGLRGDVLTFDAKDRLPRQDLDPATDPNFTAVRIDGSTTDGTVSPKANLVITPFEETDVYLNVGEGFHSNDARNAILGRGTDFSPLTRSSATKRGLFPHPRGSQTCHFCIDPGTQSWAHSRAGGYSMNMMAQGLLALACCAVLAAPAAAHPIFSRCPPDSARVGTTCIDKYEASVWQIPDPTGANRALVSKVQRGKATLADLTAAGATQLGCAFSHTAYPPSFPPDGNWTAPVYAVSVPGVRPSMCITWFQAEQACALSNKRLPTNQEWQRAAAGTPDPGATDDNTTECEVGLDGGLTDIVPTGSRSACKSSWGVYDMIGNAHERVADWVPLSQTVCPGWDVFSDDLMCLAGVNATVPSPGALVRGGDYRDAAAAGVFAVQGDIPATDDAGFLGFRCAR